MTKAVAIRRIPLTAEGLLALLSSPRETKVMLEQFVIGRQAYDEAQARAIMQREKLAEQTEALTKKELELAAAAAAARGMIVVETHELAKQAAQLELAQTEFVGAQQRAREDLVVKENRLANKIAVCEAVLAREKSLGKAELEIVDQKASLAEALQELTGKLAALTIREVRIASIETAIRSMTGADILTVQP